MFGLVEKWNMKAREWRDMAQKDESNLRQNVYVNYARIYEECALELENHLREAGNKAFYDRDTKLTNVTVTTPLTKKDVERIVVDLFKRVVW